MLKQVDGVTVQAQSRKLGPRKRNPIQQAADLTIKAMLLQGASIRKIAAALHVSPTTVQRVKVRICEQAPDAADLKTALLSPCRDEKLGKLIDHFLDKGLRMKEIKGSDALGAAKIYVDRRYPVRKAAPEIPRINFPLVNIDECRLYYSDDHQVSKPLDVTPTTEPDPTTSGNGSQPPGS